jgi:hypothetical protein
VTWAFPSLCRTARARRKGIGAPTASPKRHAPASPPPRRASSSLFPFLNNFVSILVTPSLCLPHCTRPRLPVLPFNLFCLLSFSMLSPCAFTRVNRLVLVYSCCPEFLAVFLEIALASRITSLRVVQAALNFLCTCFFDQTLIPCTVSMNDVRGRIEDKCLDKCLDFVCLVQLP